MADVKIYTKTTCPACDLAKKILSQKKVSYKEIILDNKPEELKALIKKTNMKTVPQIFINGHLIGGCSDMMDLDNKNQLDILLQAESH